MALRHEDFVNLVCGVPGTFETMGYLDAIGLSRIYDYCDHPSKFNYIRWAVEELTTETLIELYEGMISANKKEPPRVSKVTISEKKAHNKRAYFTCEHCGKTEIASNDKYCPMCGWPIEFPFED